MNEIQNLELVQRPASSASRPGIEVSAPDRWRAILDQQRQSGLSVSAFCRQQSLTASALFAWRRRLNGGQDLRRGAAGAKFVEVKRAPTLEAKPSTPSIEVCLRGIGGQALHDRRLLVRSGFDRDLLIELIRALEGMP